MSDKHKKLKSKKGMTLAEALVASAVLVIMVAGILAVIGFANTIIAKNKVQDDGYALAEGIADKLMTAISKGETDVADLAALSGAAHVNSVSSFSSGANAKEFFFALETRNNISGYKIYVRVNDDKGKQLAYITAFASVGGGTT